MENPTLTKKNLEQNRNIVFDKMNFLLQQNKKNISHKTSPVTALSKVFGPLENRKYP